MNCAFDREMVSLYADGALAPESVPDVENHVAGCGECRRMLAEFRDMGSALRALTRETAPRELVGLILAGTGDFRHRTPWRSLWWTISTVWDVAIDGGTIGDDREEAMRRESPAWVARWVLYI